MARRPRPRASPAAADELVVIGYSKGLTALPMELLLHIVSYMQGAIIPWIHECAMEALQRERREGLRVLCQLCRSLRTALLPLLWEKLEACTFTCDRMYEARQGYREYIRNQRAFLEKEVVGQLKLIVKLKVPYTSYIRVVNVVIEPKFSRSALPKLARALSLMPNLHTVQIICRRLMHEGNRIDQFRAAFTGYVYPSVKFAILPNQARSILSCFPEVVDMQFNQSYAFRVRFSEFLDSVVSNCRKVESFGWVQGWGSMSATVVEKLPKLRKVECHLLGHNVDEIRHLSKLQNLEMITLTVENSVFVAEQTPVIEAARKVLADSSRPNKQLVLQCRDSTRTIKFGNSC